MLYKDLGHRRGPRDSNEMPRSANQGVWLHLPTLGATWSHIAVLHEMAGSQKALEAHQTTLALYTQAEGAHKLVETDLIHSPRSGDRKPHKMDEEEGEEGGGAAAEAAHRTHLLPPRRHIRGHERHPEALEHYRKALAYSEAHRDGGGKHAATAHRRHGHGHGTHASHLAAVNHGRRYAPSRFTGPYRRCARETRGPGRRYQDDSGGGGCAGGVVG